MRGVRHASTYLPETTMSYPEFDVAGKPGDQTFTPEPPERKPRGCLFYGCLGAAVLGLLGVILIASAGYTLYHYVTKAVDDYTSTTREPVPQVTISDEQSKAIDDRWEAFTTAVDKGEAAEIVLDNDEVNALIARTPELKDKVYVTMKGDQVTGQISWPLDETGIPFLRGRFLNGTTTLTVSLDHGYLDVRMKSIDVNGKTMPDDLAKNVGQQNLVKDVKFDDDVARKMRQIETLEVKDDHLYIRSRAKSRPGESDAEKPKDEPKPGDDVPKTDEPKKDDTPKAEPAEAPKAEAPKDEAPKDEA